MREMAAIGIDILEIGSKKWDQSQRYAFDEDIQTPTNFMLPNVENVG